MAIREAAFASMEKAASNMKSRAFRKDGHNVDIAIGTMVQMNAAEVDRAKTDVATITGVVVEHRHMEDVLHYRVAAHAGVLKALYARHQLKPLKTPLDLLGLDSVLDNWKTMPEVGERACMRLVSAVGGQGLLHCHCVGTCLTRRCSCRKAKRLCNSRCHPRRSTCRNMEEED